MKKLLIITFCLFLSSQAFAESVSLNKEQFENISVINEALRKKYPQYKGMSGSQDKMEIVGISAESFNKEAAKISFQSQDQIKADKITNRESAITKLKAIGLTDEELAALGIGG